MSSFADQTERGNSTHSLPSRGGSGTEMDSNYLVESGIYISSFAATIFVAALITVGVLFITLLITLTVMLQSCQNQNTWVIELPEARVKHSYCRVLALQAEFNRLEADEFPAICKTDTIQYMEKEQYLKDFSLTIRAVKSYFSSLMPKDDGLDVILMDIDGMLLWKQLHNTGLLQQRFHQHDGNNRVEEGHLPVDILLLELHSMLQSSGWSLILITGQPEPQRNVTTESLISAGYGGWSSLIMRSESEMQLEGWEYFSRRQVELLRTGFRIMGVISSQMDALRGPSLGKRVFKLPNSRYYKLEPHLKSVEPL